ncbi:hypothetical protein JFT85_14435 [Pseudomonas sp. TH04]|uniref:hypothetical protein n=1 Tax=Pseudomonas sp. TH04 TaxID=2796370 RepID=UPI00191221CD|nr:hypothetical protein [Pseudomonas sp. TH04]MBK5545966.1 hypothetical protein [Pseudomonas sp. TH04]
MSTLTNQRDEVRRIATFLPQITMATIAKVELLDGQIIVGVVRNVRGGNRIEDHRTYYYGEATLETLDGKSVTIDGREVKAVERVWDEQKDAFEKAGLIITVDLPE